MKIKITRADGTIIEAEGTAEECSEFAQAIAPAPAPQLQLTTPFVPIEQRQQVFPWDIYPEPPNTIENPWIVQPYVPWITTPGISPWINPSQTPGIDWWRGHTISGTGIQLCEHGCGTFDLASAPTVSGSYALPDGASYSLC